MFDILDCLFEEEKVKKIEEYDYRTEMLKECIKFFTKTDRNKRLKKVPSRYLFKKEQVEYVLDKLQNLSHEMGYFLDEDGIYEINFQITLNYKHRR